MSRTKGTYSISANIETNASAPLDARSRVNTLADLTDSASFPYPYVGMETFVVSEGVKYVLTSLPTTNAANWQPADAEELIKTALGDDIFDGEGTIKSDNNNVHVIIEKNDLQLETQEEDFWVFRAPGLIHPQSLLNCVIEVEQTVPTSITLDNGEYVHDSLRGVDSCSPVGFYSQDFTITIDGTEIFAGFLIADEIFFLWADGVGNVEPVINAINSISYDTPCVHHKVLPLNYETVVWEQEYVIPYLRGLLPLTVTDNLELGLQVMNVDYPNFSMQPPFITDTGFWEYAEDVEHPITGEPVDKLWFGSITLSQYWDSDNNILISPTLMLWLSDHDIVVSPESPFEDHTLLIDIFRNAGITAILQQPVTPGRLQIGGENGAVITQSDITIGGKSILNQQSGGSGGGGAVDPDVAALVQQFKDADVTISKTPAVDPQDLFTTITFTDDNCSTENIFAGGEGSYLATATLYDKRIKAAGLYNFYIEFKEPWGPYEVICQIYEGNGQCIVYDDNLGVWSGYCAPRNRETHHYESIKLEISDGQIRFVCNKSQNFNTLLDIFESVVIGYEEAEPEGLLTIGNTVIKGTTDLTVNNEPIVSDGLQKIQRDFENADLTVSKTSQAEDDVYTTTVYDQQSVTDWYTHTVLEPTDQGSAESSVYTYFIENFEVTSTLNTLSIALQSGYTFEYYGSITDGAPSDPSLITYSPMSVGLDNYMGAMWIGYGSIHDVNTDDYFDLKYTIQANHTINFRTSSNKTLEDIIDSITLSAPGKYNIYSGKITVGNNLQITESDIIVNNRSVIEPASVTNPGRVILTRANGATIYDDAASYDTDVNDVPITLTASQIKAMINKAIEESGGGGGNTIHSLDVPVTVTNTNLVSDSDILPIDN